MCLALPRLHPQRCHQPAVTLCQHLVDAPVSTLQEHTTLLTVDNRHNNDTDKRQVLAIPHHLLVWQRIIDADFVKHPVVNVHGHEQCRGMGCHFQLDHPVQLLVLSRMLSDPSIMKNVYGTFQNISKSNQLKLQNLCRTTDGYQQPHGGILVNLMVTEEQKIDLIAACGENVIECSDRNACDVELLCVGGFSPLTGFMDKATYIHCVQNMR